jgi:hypothetical protein
VKGGDKETLPYFIIEKYIEKTKKWKFLLGLFGNGMWPCE